MDPDGNRLQNSCSPRHWGHSTMHRVPPVSGTTTTIYIPSLSNQVYEGYRCMDLITVHTHCLVKYTLKCFIHYALIHLFD